MTALGQSRRLHHARVESAYPSTPVVSLQRGEPTLRGSSRHEVMSHADQEIGVSMMRAIIVLPWRRTL
jgi:hypothetical protein